MIIEKTIKVTSPACDICEKPTSRSKWNSYYLYLFCKNHSWIEGILDILKNEVGSSFIETTLKFLKSQLFIEKS